MIQDTAHFPVAAWIKDPSKVDMALVLALEAVRGRAGEKIHINVAWDDSGHQPHSQHYLGKAVDFHFYPGLTPLQQLEAILSVPEIHAIGWYPEWNTPGWHVDIRDTPMLYWKRVSGVYVYTHNLDQFKGWVK